DARQAASGWLARAVALLRRDRQDGGRADPVEDLDQRSSQGLICGMALAGTDPVALAQALIRCPSVTPEEAGALSVLEDVLAPAGFTVHRMTFSEPGTPDVENLYARIGAAGPNLCFAGHTDVVPPGDLAKWSVPPFSGEIRDGVLFGRGAVDMKGAIACFVAAAMRYMKRRGGQPQGSISLLITGDEEGPSINGTAKVLEWLKERGERLDGCV